MRKKRFQPTIGLFILSLWAATPTFAQSANDRAADKPFTVQIRYGVNADPQTSAAAQPRRLEFTVAARDAGRIATRDARLDYTVSDAASGDMTVSIAFTYAGANGSRTVTTQRLLPRRQWHQLAFDNATQAPDEGVYIRIDARR